MSTAILMCALFFAKVIDNALSTTKTILIQRNHCILAGIALAASNFIYLCITKNVVNSDSSLALIVVSVASGVGCCLAVAVSSRLCAFSYTNGSRASHEWRNDLYLALIARTGLKGNRSKPTLTAGFYVLRYTNMPAVLLELGFMDSSTDVPIILTNDYAQKCAKAIVEVLVKRGGLKKKAVSTSSDTLYLVQLGAFANKANAEALAKELKEKWYQTYIVST